MMRQVYTTIRDIMIRVTSHEFLLLFPIFFSRVNHTSLVVSMNTQPNRKFRCKYWKIMVINCCLRIISQVLICSFEIATNRYYFSSSFTFFLYKDSSLPSTEAPLDSDSIPLRVRSPLLSLSRSPSSIFIIVDSPSVTSTSQDSMWFILIKQLLFVMFWRGEKFVPGKRDLFRNKRSKRDKILLQIQMWWSRGEFFSHLRKG